MKLTDIGTNNVKEYELNPRLWYAMVTLDYWQKTCKEKDVLMTRLDLFLNQWFWNDENNIKNCSNNCS